MYPGFESVGAAKLSGKEIFAAAAAYGYDEEVLFTINYRGDITTACYVGYGVLLSALIPLKGTSRILHCTARESEVAQI